MSDNLNDGKIGYSSSSNFAPSDILYMLKDLPDAYCIFKVMTDPFGTVKDMLFLFANEKYSQLVGKPSAELVGNTYLKTVMNRDEDWIKYSYQAAILRQSATIRTYNIQHDKWLEYCAVPVYQKGFCAFIIHDITIAKKSEDNRELASNTSKLVIDCATALSSAEFGKGIRKVLKLLGQTIKADRVSIVEVKDNKVVDVREWLNDAHASNLPNRKNFERMNIIDMWDRQLKGKNTIVINDTSVIRDYEEEVYNELLAGSISRYMVTTLHDNDEIIGYLVADNYENTLPINVAEVMESVAIFISYDMRNRALTKEMEYLGSHDALTGLGNRNSLNQVLLVLSGMSSVAGVCYTDINGLKAINAREGHDAGDAKIKEAANIVASVFKRKNCYRIGGDEFLAIIPEITQEKFEEQVKKLRTKLAKVSAAIGSVWIEDSGEINKAVKRADERMYEDKAAYYKDKEHERRGKHEQEEQE